MADMSESNGLPWPNLKSPWLVSAVLLVLVAVFDWGNLPTITLFALAAFFSTLKYIIFAVFLIAALKAAGAEPLRAVKSG